MIAKTTVYDDNNNANQNSSVFLTTVLVLTKITNIRFVIMH